MKLLTLNIEGDRHLAEVRAAIAEHLPDIVCLQEALRKDCATLASMGGYSAAFGTSLAWPDRASKQLHEWGVAVLTRVPLRHQTLVYYTEDAPIRVFNEPNDARRLLLITEIEDAGKLLRIATTHFTWSPDGHLNDDQRTDFSQLKRKLVAYPDYVLCGDFNAPRGRELFAKFTTELGLTDHLPSHVTSTLDPRFHRIPSLELVVDTIFSTSHYCVENVQLVDAVSDHKGILATIKRRD